MNKIVVWDSAESPIGSANPNVEFMFWRSYGVVGFDNASYIPRWIEDNSDLLRAKYLAWIYELGQRPINDKNLIDSLEIRSNFSYWWMTPLVEKCNFAKSPQISDAIRLYAFDSLMEGRTNCRVELVTSNRKLVSCMQVWCNARGLGFLWRNLETDCKKRPFLRRFYNALPHSIRGLVWLLKFLSGHWALKGVGLEEWRKTSGEITFFSYFFNLDPDKGCEGKFRSKYWTELPDVVAEEAVPTNWLHLYVKDDSVGGVKDARTLVQRYNDGSNGLQSHVFLESFLNFSVVIRTLIDLRLILRASKKINPILEKNIDTIDLWPLFQDEWLSSMYGVSAVRNILMYNLFESALKELPEQKTGVYLQENQGWEFGLNAAWKMVNNSDLVGFPHSTVRYWDLRYFFDARTYSDRDPNSIPLPDKVACNGKAILETYIAAQYPRHALIEVESLRYLYLIEVADRKSTTCNDVKRVLFLGDYLPRNTQRQLEILLQAVPLISVDVDITVKPHPACPINETQCLDNVAVLKNNDLQQLLKETDIIFASATTSASVDGYCYGLPVITFLDSEDLDLSPLRQCDGVISVYGSLELANAIDNLAVIGRSPSKAEEYFFLDEALPRWKNLLFRTDSLCN